MLFLLQTSKNSSQSRRTFIAFSVAFFCTGETELSTVFTADWADQSRMVDSDVARKLVCGREWTSDWFNPSDGQISHQISSHSKSPISLARLRTKFGERAFSHAGPATWNANHSATEPPPRCIGLSKQPAICRDVTRVQIASPVFHNQLSTQMTTFCWIEFLLLQSNLTEAQIAEFKRH